MYDSEHEVEQARTRYAEGLADIEQQFEALTADHPHLALDALGQHVNFYLGYQGRDDRRLQERYAAILHRVASANFPQWAQPKPVPPLARDGRIRVGYVSAHLRNHSVAKLFAGWMSERTASEFEVFAYHNGRTVDATTRSIASRVDHFRHLPGELEPLCRAVADDELHVLVYLDVRHRRMALASSLRLAPVQCAAWAHPVTTGSPTIDYYLSSDAMEPPDGDRHYTETLVRLPGLGVYYPKPVVPRPLLTMPRSAFGLGNDRRVFLCCQSTFKYLPQHDDLFIAIARRVPTAQFAFVVTSDAMGARFSARLARAFAAAGLDASDYCVFLPQLTTPSYWNLNLLSDVFLDTLEWSGGVTTLEAVACELPVVTLPGPFMRGRHSYGILRQLGVTDTVAHDKHDYVEIAVRLAEDRGWRSDVVARMKAGHDRLYYRTDGVRALEQFFRTALAHRTSAA